MECICKFLAKKFGMMENTFFEIILIIECLFIKMQLRFAHDFLRPLPGWRGRLFIERDVVGDEFSLQLAQGGSVSPLPLAPLWPEAKILARPGGIDPGQKSGEKTAADRFETDEPIRSEEKTGFHHGLFFSET